MYIYRQMNVGQWGLGEARKKEEKKKQTNNLYDCILIVANGFTLTMKAKLVNSLRMQYCVSKWKWNGWPGLGGGFGGRGLYVEVRGRMIGQNGAESKIQRTEKPRALFANEYIYFQSKSPRVSICILICMFYIEDIVAGGHVFD